ncbi:hypothetical protein [Paraferrimonas sedimenticola]|uniref:Uncharacterized protein n=1 Tax=Paraferrimonas sedimenticola TaxID=375674 RepID=A0AA37RVE9_9GAMM|nr:hypothetical protein [Paraferrimonas sedimenticola]GLP96410.1 hypothetical protein GCM10007895_17160 [Paraferrimonas sedimenticola]
MSTNKPSNFQQAITGEWHGLPSVFDADGNHTGFNKVSRASVFEGDRTTYWMETNFMNSGELRNRFDLPNCRFEFGVIDSDQDRVYCGPDFVGAGRPFGMLVDSNYYSPGWNCDLKTVNLVLPERGIQVYSSLLYEGETLVSVFNGIYKVTQDHDTNPDTQAMISDFLDGERQRASQPFVLPVKEQGQWKGTFQVYDVNQEYVGDAEVVMDYQPTSLTTADVQVKVTGAIEKEYSYSRTRVNNSHSYSGDGKGSMYGNGRSYGRYLWSVQHLHGEAFKIRSRDAIIDDENSICSIWQIYKSGKEALTAFGVLEWTETEQVLKAQYVK